MNRSIVSAVLCATKRQHLDIFVFFCKGAVDFKEEVSITAVSAGKDYMALGSTDGYCIILPLNNLKVSSFLFA